MATEKYWLDSDGNVTLAGNWSGASVPTLTDNLWIMSGNKTVNQNMDFTAQSVTTTSVRFGPDWQGQFGDESNPFKIGNAIANVWINSPKAKGIFLSTNDTTNAVVDTWIEEAGSAPNACVLWDGTWTNVYHRKGLLRINDLAIVTTLYCQMQNDRAGDARVIIEQGAAMTTANVYGGDVECEIPLTTVNMYGGRFRHVANSTTTPNITTVNMYGPTAEFYFNSQGGTITTLNGHAGTLYCGGGVIRKRTITTYNAYSGHVGYIGTGVAGVLVTTMNDKFGGRVYSELGRSLLSAPV